MRSFILICFFLCTYQLGAGIDKGSVAFIQGRAFIERGIKTLPAKIGSILKVGDKVNVEEGSQVSIELFGSGLIKITEKTSFQIPETEAGSERTGKISLFFGGLWVKAKKLLKGESFEIKTPTATAGVRGTDFGAGFDPDTGETDVDVAEGEVYAADNDGNEQTITEGFSYTADSSGGSAPTYNPEKVVRLQAKAAATPSNNSESARKAAQQAQSEAKKKIEAAKKKGQDQEARKKAMAKRKKAAERAKQAKEAQKKAAAAKKKAEDLKKKKAAAAKAKAAAAAKAKAAAAAKAKAAAAAKAKAAAAAKAKAAAAAQAKAAAAAAKAKAAAAKAKAAQAKAAQAKAAQAKAAQAKAAQAKAAQAKAAQAKAAQAKAAQAKATQTKAAQAKATQAKAAQAKATQAAAQAKANQVAQAQAAQAKAAQAATQAKAAQATANAQAATAKAEAETVAKAEATAKAAAEAATKTEAEPTSDGSAEAEAAAAEAAAAAAAEAEAAAAEAAEAAAEAARVAAEEEALRLQERADAEEAARQEAVLNSLNEIETKNAAMDSFNKQVDQLLIEDNIAPEQKLTQLLSIIPSTSTLTRSNAQALKNQLEEVKATSEQLAKVDALIIEQNNLINSVINVSKNLATMLFEDVTQRKDEFNSIQNQINQVVGNQNMSLTLKKQEISSLKTRAQEITNNISTETFNLEKAAITALIAINPDENPITEEDFTDFSPSELDSLNTAIQNIEIADVIIDFETLVSPSLQRSNQLVLPVRYGAKNYKITVDRTSLKDHKLVQQIIENELKVQIAKDKFLQDEQFRAQELKRLKEQDSREKRESDYNPATATKDGQGMFLPVGF